MKKKFDQVYQFKITLRDIKPPIWRRIQVPETYTFWDLHVAIQDAMGWSDYHLHEFEMVDPSTGLKVNIGIPDEDFGGIWGYENFLEIINDPDNEEYEDMIEWVGGEFDPEHFDVKEVSFDDPDKRRRIAFG